MPKQKIRTGGIFVDLAPAAGLDLDPAVGGSTTSPATFVASTSGQNDNVSVMAPTLPAGVQEGDLLIYVSFSNQSQDHPTPAGWTPLYSIQDPTYFRRMAAFYKFASASEPASYSFTTGHGATGINGWAIEAYRNAQAPVLVGVAYNGAAFPSASALNGNLVIGHMGSYNDATNRGAGAGYTASVDYFGTGPKQIVSQRKAVTVDGPETPPTINGDDLATLIIPQGSSNHAIVLADANKIVELTNGTTVTVTIPTNATQAIPVGNFVVVRRIGAGAVNIAVAGGVTLTGVTTIPKQYDEVWLHKRGTNTWHATLQPGSDLATQAELDAVVASLSAITANNQTGTAYGLVLSDAGKVVELNNAATVTVTVPLNATEAFPIGTVIELWQQGAGQVVVAPAGGVTIRSTEGKLKLYGQYAGASLRKRAADEWVLVGDLVA